MPLDNIDDLSVSNGCPDYGSGHIVINSIPYPLERFRCETSDFVKITITADSRDFIGEMYHLTPSPKMAERLLKATSVNFRGPIFTVTQN